MPSIERLMAMVRSRGVVSILVFGYVLVIVRSAWLADDAYVTLRCVDNFVHGYGLTWNVDERVQAFVHPLWALVVAVPYAVTREDYYTVLALGVALSATAFSVLVWRLCRSVWKALFLFVILVMSPVFIDYSTSGLEGPLAHLLFVLFCVYYLRSVHLASKLRVLVFLGALLTLCRLEFAWIVAPPAWHAVVCARRERQELQRIAFDIALGCSPLLAWWGFSLVYYGFPFPNEVYAERYAGLPRGQLFAQGMLYFLSLVRSDPFSLFLIASALAFAWAEPDVRIRFLAVGVVLYLAHFLVSGGDVTLGRWLSLCVLFAAIVAANHKVPLFKPQTALFCYVPLFLMGLLAPRVPLRDSLPGAVRTDIRGVTDERLVYSPATGLSQASRIAEQPHDGLIETGRRLWATGARTWEGRPIGLVGYNAGPTVHVIDRLGHADPLLARLPAERNIDFAPRQLEHAMPIGYRESLESSSADLRDRSLARYYDKLRAVVAGPVFASRRWLEIWRFLRGKNDPLIDIDKYRHPAIVRVAAARLVDRRPQGFASSDTHNVSFTDDGLEIVLGRTSHAGHVDLTLDSDDTYRVAFLSRTRELGSFVIRPSYINALAAHAHAVPREAARRGFDRVRIYPEKGDGTYVVGHLWVVH